MFYELLLVKQCLDRIYYTMFMIILKNILYRIFLTLSYFVF